jgi:protein-L-isoaspartate(D-aspartate) O-methyltransferase
MSSAPPAKNRPGFPAQLPKQTPLQPAKKLGGAPINPTRPAPVSVKTQPQAALRPIVAPPQVQGTGLDSSAVRARMVQKLQAAGLADARVLEALHTVERHRFVDSALVNQAYEDTSLPIGLGQTISKPNVVARMMELLLANTEGKLGRTLEIGTGCGYQAALLSVVCTEVYSMERLKGLHEKARDNLRALRIANLHLILGDGMLGYPKGAPYSGIIAAAGGEALPQAWLDQLAVGGRLVAPIANAKGAQALMVVDKTENGLKQSVLEAVQFVPLKSGLA